MGKGCQGQAGSGRSCLLRQAGLSVNLHLLQRVYQRCSLAQGLLLPCPGPQEQCCALVVVLWLARCCGVHSSLLRDKQLGVGFTG